jgi:hypothetical protein
MLVLAELAAKPDNAATPRFSFHSTHREVVPLPAGALFARFNFAAVKRCGAAEWLRK